MPTRSPPSKAPQTAQETNTWSRKKARSCSGVCSPDSQGSLVIEGGAMHPSRSRHVGEFQPSQIHGGFDAEWTSAPQLQDGELAHRSSRDFQDGLRAIRAEKNASAMKSGTVCPSGNSR